MSAFDIEELSPQAQISHYILEWKKNDFFLSSTDYSMIEEWLIQAHFNTDMVLLVLSGLLPQFYKDPSKKTKPLRLLHSKVLRELESLKEKL